MKMQVKRYFNGTVPRTGETVLVKDERVVVEQTTHHNVGARTFALGGEPHCTTEDGREVRVKNAGFKYVDYENLAGEWEIQSGSGWEPLLVSDIAS